MPTYEYKCNACKKKLEIFQSIKEDPKRKCAECGKNALERLIGTGGAIIFKGSGFYQTDYRSESYKKAAESDKPSDTAGGESKGPETKSESKSETKSETKSTAAKSEPKSKLKPEKGEKKAKSKV